MASRVSLTGFSEDLVVPLLGSLSAVFDWPVLEKAVLAVDLVLLAALAVLAGMVSPWLGSPNGLSWREWRMVERRRGEAFRPRGVRTVRRPFGRKIEAVSRRHRVKTPLLGVMRRGFHPCLRMDLWRFAGDR